MRAWWSAISLRGLRVQILLWTILPLTILLIGFSLTGVRSHQESMRAMVAERDTGLARVLARDIAALLNRYTSSLQIAASSAAHGGDLQALDARLADLSQALDGMTLWVVGSDGQVVAGRAEAPAWVGTAVSPSRRDPGAADEAAILALAAEQTVLWIVPIDEDGGWLVGALPLPVLQLPALFAASGIGTTASVLLVNPDREALYAVGDPGDPDTRHTMPGIDEALAGQSGVAFAPHPQGEQVVAYAPVPGAGWALVLRESWEALADPLLRFDRIMPFVLLTAAVVSLLALVFGLRYVVRPLQQLDAQANQIGRETSMPRPIRWAASRKSRNCAAPWTGWRANCAATRTPCRITWAQSPRRRKRNAPGCHGSCTTGPCRP
ncbi:MAG: cache domain-containing protein [Acidimicrobiia bacterium]|nr:cache domain-containing protein [Acidimicrobiia bacterium]